MSDYKTRQKMFHHLEQTDDWLDDKPITVLDLPNSDLIDHIKNYFEIPVTDLIYPAKSYAVAIIYAKLLKKHFNISFYTALDDPDLLAGNDPHFVRYRHNKEVYDAAIDHVTKVGFNDKLPQVAKTIEYFNQEFYLVENPYFDNKNITSKV